MWLYDASVDSFFRACLIMGPVCCCKQGSMEVDTGLYLQTLPCDGFHITHQTIGLDILSVESIFLDARCKLI